MKKLLFCLLAVFMVVQAVRGTQVVYADEEEIVDSGLELDLVSESNNDVSSNLIEFGDDWRSLMDLPIKLPAGGTAVFDYVSGWVYDTDRYVLEENLEYVYNLGLSFSLCEGTKCIVVSQNKPFIYSMYESYMEDEEYDGLYLNKSDTIKEALEYSSTVFEDYSDYTVLKLGDNYLDSTSSCYILIYNDSNELLYKIPFDEAGNYIYTDFVEVPSVSDFTVVSVDEVLVDGTCIGALVNLTWSSKSGGVVSEFTITDGDLVINRSLSLEEINSCSCTVNLTDNGTYNIQPSGGFYTLSSSVDVEVSCIDSLGYSSDKGDEGDIVDDFGSKENSESNVESNLSSTSDSNFSYTVTNDGKDLIVFVSSSCILRYNGTEVSLYKGRNRVGVADCKSHSMEFVLGEDIVGTYIFDVHDSQGYGEVSSDSVGFSILYVAIAVGVVLVLVGGGLVVFFRKKKSRI